MDDRALDRPFGRVLPSLNHRGRSNRVPTFVILRYLFFFSFRFSFLILKLFAFLNSSLVITGIFALPADRPFAHSLDYRRFAFTTLVMGSASCEKCKHQRFIPSDIKHRSWRRKSFTFHYS